MANTLQRTIDFCRTFTQVRPYTGIGNFAADPLEPALSIGDWVLQFMLSPPFAWRWNRNKTLFVIEPTIMTTKVTSVGTATITLVSGPYFITGVGWNDQTCYINGLPYIIDHVVSPVSLVLTTPVTAGVGVSFVCGGQDYILALSDFGWPEKASITDGVTFSEELVILPDLALDIQSGKPHCISPVNDDGEGNITFRFMPAPSATLTVHLDYQKSAPPFTAMDDTWEPVPDYLSYLYNQGCLYKCFEMAVDERMTEAFQIFMRNLIAANNGLTDSQVNLFMADRIATQREVQQKLGSRTPPPQQ
jgi:hypothetical protein